MSKAPIPWLPVRAALRPDALYLAARQIPASELQDAFMQETVARVAAPETVLQVARADLGRSGLGAAPAGLIFHVARCGSTLVSQLLKQQGAVTVYSEPLPCNEMLLPPHPWNRADMVAALRSLGPVFAQHARGPYVIKFSSWNTLYCDLLADAFPETPWVLCLRDPLEVAVSLLREPPGWLRTQEEPARRLATQVVGDGAALTDEERAVRWYEALCNAACRLDPSRGRLVPYERLPDDIWQTIAPQFGLTIDAAAQRRMAEAAQRHAKAPLAQPRRFSADSESKRQAASSTLRRAVDEYARPALARLTARYPSQTM